MVRAEEEVNEGQTQSVYEMMSKEEGARKCEDTDGTKRVEKGDLTRFI